MYKYGFVRAAALSPEIILANPEHNVKKAFELIRNTVDKRRAQIIALPEMYLCGYTCADLLRNNSLLENCENVLLWLAEKTHNMEALIIVGLPLRQGDRLYNCAAVLHMGKVVGVVPKAYIPNYGEFYEKRWFSAAKTSVKSTIKIGNTQAPFGKLLFRLDDSATVGIEICEDLWVPVPPSCIMAMNGANIIVNLSASNELVTKNSYRCSLIKQQSARCACGYIYSDAGVGESTTDLVFSGSCFVAENGSVLSESKRFTPDSFAIADIDVQRLSAQRRNSEFFDNADDFQQEYTVIETPIGELPKDAVSRTYSCTPFVPENQKLRAEHCEEILSIQAAGLIKRIKHINAKRAILGISGGLDSTLALLVTVRAFAELKLPPENVQCVTMPGFGTTAGTKNNACNLVTQLGCSLKEINIVPACEQHMRDIEHDMKVHDVTYENVQARERTQILMDLANKQGALLVGTGDLSELALGWCTFNGDHMSMYDVNCGVPKTLVRHLVKYIADCSGEGLSETLNAVIDTPVSPELLPPDENGTIVQKTEDVIGPYELHDFFLYHFMRFGFTQEKIVFIAERAFEGKYSKGEIARWLRVFTKRLIANQFKRSCSPDGPKVGSVALSPRGDLRMPSDADSEVFDNMASVEMARYNQK